MHILSQSDVPLLESEHPVEFFLLFVNQNMYFPSNFLVSNNAELILVLVGDPSGLSF